MDTTIRQGYFEEGVKEAVVTSPNEELYRLGLVFLLKIESFIN